MTRLWLCLFFVWACSSESEEGTTATSTSAQTVTSTTAGAGGAGGQTSSATSGSGGECPIGSNSTVVEATAANMCPEPGQSALTGTGMPGDCCRMALDCAPTCCACTGSANEYNGVFCQDGICATAADTCPETAGDGCP